MSKAVFAMMAAGTAMSAYGSYQQGKMQQQLNEYNAAIAENNKILADQKYQLDIRDQKMRYRKLRGKQNVAYAKAGVSLDMGSAIDLAEETGILNEWELLKMKYNTDVVKAGYTGQAAKSRFVGAQSYASGKFNAASTLLTGGTSTYKYGTEQGYFG